jgi:hypothetical protein
VNPKSLKWSLESLTPPWGDAPSIYAFIRDNPKSSELPDEKRDPNKITFAAGAWDGVMGHHVAGSSTAELWQRADVIEQALENLLRSSTDENLRALYQVVTSENMYPLSDEFTKRLEKRVPDARPQLAAIGRYFLFGADHREAVKFGIIMIAMAGDASDLKALETLAGHDEFTMFAALAATQFVDDSEQCLWRIAQKVHGLGRVQLVERLDGTTNPEIQDWMLREGFRNHIMDNYLAAICARTGKLHEALAQPSIDTELLNSAGKLLSALLEDGPAAGMDDYEHAPIVLRDYLRHLSRAADPALEHFLTVDHVLRFLDAESNWEERFATGEWSNESREALRQRCQEILSRDTWLVQAEKALDSNDGYQFYLADTVASRFGRNTWEINFQKVRQAPLRASWYRLMELTDASNIDEVLAFASDVLPLDEIAVGPANELGIGPGYEAEQTLDWILQDLVRFPGYGWPLIKAGLQSRVTRNRNMALRAFLAWPREQWPADAFAILQQASRLEPNEEIRKRLAEAVKVH